jgi:dTDP-4-amino-4,6-dideoxygalactose transaminase
LDIGITPQKKPGTSKHVYQIYAFLVSNQTDRDKVLDYLISEGVEAKNYFDPPIHRQKYYSKNYPYYKEMTVTDNIAKRIICLPFDDKLSKEEMEYMIDKVYEAIG